ncbi:MAG: 3-dehydroquinate synthase [Oscillospiraceae bacterium]
MNILNVQVAQPYNVIISMSIDKYLVDFLKSNHITSKIAVITDSNVKPLYFEHLYKVLNDNGFVVCCFEIKSGEIYKSLDTVSQIYSFLCEHQISRKDIIISLGGGVVGDIAGFCAATYLRSIPYINIPTTLLSQVDSSIGGKTGVNTSFGKNLVGAFYQPRLVCCDINTLKTLPLCEFNSGMSEVIKYSLISSDLSADDILNSKNDSTSLTQIITSSIKIKAAIVSEDTFDNGRRMVLNLGHTVAHAIESFYEYKKYNHGQAVAIGLSTITKACEAINFCPSGTHNKTIKLLKKYSLPIECEAKLTSLVPFMLADKKNESEYINSVIVKNFGEVEIMKMKKKEFISFLRGGYEY